MGNTLGIDIDAPYQLKRLSGKRQFGVTLYEQNVGCGMDSSDGIIGGDRNSARQTARNTSFSRAANTSDNGGSDNVASAVFVALEMSLSTPNQAICNSDGCTEQLEESAEQSKTERRDDENSDCGQESDSVEKLTWGIAIREDVDIYFGNSESRRN